MNPRSAAVETTAGIALLLAGLGLLGEAGWYGTTHYFLLEEPPLPGKTPNPSVTSWKFDEAEMEAAFEQGRRDARWMRIHLYAIAPAGVLLVVLGVWLLTADYRRRSSMIRDP